ncbi:MAG: methyltransferase domain-containing protein [Pseudomonadota bacterium]
MLQFDAKTTELLEIAYQGADVSRRRRMAFDAMHLSVGDTVVDVGCGNGLLTEEIARAVGEQGRVVGVDPSDAMRAHAVDRCSHHTTVSIVAGSADALPLDDQDADTVVAVQVLEYLTRIESAVREAYRILRPGGRFVAVDTGCNTLDWYSEDTARMRRIQLAWEHHYAEANVAAQWSEWVRSAGFKAVSIEPFTYCDVTLRPDGIAFMLMHLMSRYALENGHVSDAEAQAWFDEQVDLARRGRFFFSLSYYCMSAIKC